MEQVFVPKKKGFVRANKPPLILILQPMPVTHAVLVDTPLFVS